MALEIEYKATADLVPYARNSRTHSDFQVAQIAASIKEFGFTNPVLIDEAGGIIAGHGRVLAAKTLALESVPCIVLGGLSEAQKKAYVIQDNKLALNAGWDFEVLKLELHSISDLDESLLELTGFFGPELSDLMFDDPVQESEGAKEIDVDDFELGCKCPKCGFEFEPQK